MCAAELAAHIRHQRSQIGIGEHLAESRHLLVVSLAANLNRPAQTVQHDADEAVLRTGEPRRSFERRCFSNTAGAAADVAGGAVGIEARLAGIGRG